MTIRPSGFAPIWMTAALLAASTSAAQTSTSAAQTSGFAVIASTSDLPNAPSALLVAGSDTGPVPGPQDSARKKEEAQRASQAALPPCERMVWGFREKPGPPPGQGCREDPIQMIVTSREVAPLTPTQKAELAGHNIIDPFNLITITGYSAIYVGFESHSPYGPGLKGWGRLTGYSLAEDTQGQFFGVYAIPSLAHEDPRYHRMPGRSVKVRLAHALVHTLVAQHDDGTLMPNYAVLLTYPISAEISNTYVPGISTTGSSTRDRILLGYATNPASDIIAEFLPDLAKRVHIRVVFVQQILNNIAARGTTQ